MLMKIYPALHEDISSGWVWIGVGESFQRSVIRIECKETKRSIYCEALKLDENYMKRYKERTRHLIDPPEKALVINEWYRQRLGNLKTQIEYNFKIKSRVKIIGRLKALIGHPQAPIRISFWLAFISIFVGFIGLIISLLSIIL